MVDMQQQYSLYPETLFLAVYILDKYLEVRYNKPLFFFFGPKCLLGVNLYLLLYIEMGVF